VNAARKITMRLDAVPERPARTSGIVPRGHGDHNRVRFVQGHPMTWAELLVLGVLVIALSATWAALSGCQSVPPVKAPTTDASVTVTHDSWYLVGDRRTP
jgi:hypothetical protein